jgi:acetyl-CoA carboxylase biotin carboxylase subunit
MCEAAVRLIKNAKYSNAATVEFIVDQDNNFYFIEVNARIQVEHPVTEAVTGIDLIKAQIRIASGETLWLGQEDVPHRGVAIECRINAEDPTKNFQPSAGRIESIGIPGGFGVRFESHVHAGYNVPPYYDSMIGKLIVHQPTREEAIRCMLRALGELRVRGIQTTADFHQKLLRDAAFVEGRMDTTYVERNLL